MSYQSKSNNSFESRLRIYIFDVVVNNIPFNLKTFLNYDLKNKKEIIEVFTAEYYQSDREHKINGKSLDVIYDNMKAIRQNEIIKSEQWSQQYYENTFPSLLSKEEYDRLKETKICEYCEITIDKINELASKRQLFKKNERGWKMEIDRKDPNQEYTTENCVAACYWCNNAKTDEFTHEEFKPIGEAIKQIWQSRLK